MFTRTRSYIQLFGFMIAVNCSVIFIIVLTNEDLARRTVIGDSDRVERHPSTTTTVITGSVRRSKCGGFSHNNGKVDSSRILEAARSTRQKTIVYAIPSVERKRKSYLVHTVDALVTNMDSSDKENSLILIMLTGKGGNDPTYVENMKEKLVDKYSHLISEGLIEIITPRPSWYLPEPPPNSTSRTRKLHWRTRQNLDIMMLMRYGEKRADYYIQLEDDLQVVNGYSRTIWNYLQLHEDEDWFSIEFAFLGFIGKAFRSKRIPELVCAIGESYDKQPVDWIWEEMVKRQLCSPASLHNCSLLEARKSNMYFPAQFQHVGYYSSQELKIQRLKEPYFNRYNRNGSRNNPPATVDTSMKYVHSTNVSDVYHSTIYTWLKRPVRGDFIRITFDQQIRIKDILLSTGNNLHSHDLFRDETSVAIQERKSSIPLVLGEFDQHGRFFKRLKEQNASILLITINRDVENCVWLDQLYITWLE